MKSKIATLIKLSREVVAVIPSETCPPEAVQFAAGKWACVMGLLTSAAKGKTAAASNETVVCPGGRAGTGYAPLKLGTIEYFLSVGGVGEKPGEFYKETPALARAYAENLPRITPKPYLVFKPLSAVAGGEQPASVIFLVNADQLSALAGLANYDRADQDGVQLKFGAGCAQSILYSMMDEAVGRDVCTIGLTDPSARKCIDKDLLSFSIPYHRFLQMEAKAEGSFLTKDTWQRLSARITGGQ